MDAETIRQVLVRKQNTIIHVLCSYCIGLAFVCILAFGVYQLLDAGMIPAVLVVVKLFYILMAFSAFMMIWNVKADATPTERILGYGCLASCIFLSLHINFKPEISIHTFASPALASGYGGAAQLAEAVSMFISMVYKRRFPINRYASLAITILLSFAVSVFIHSLQTELSGLSDSVLMHRLMLRCPLIVLVVVSLIRIWNRIEHRAVVTYRYVFSAALFLLTSNVIRAFFSSDLIYILVLDHLVRGMYYVFLFRALFVSTVTYPYDKLNEANAAMDELLNDLPIGVMTCSHEGIVTYINHTGTQLLRTRKEEIIGRTTEEIAQNLSDGEGTGETAATLALEIKSGCISGIHPYHREQGQRLMLDVKAHRVSSGVLVLFNDARAEQELQNLRLQTQTILNAIANMVLVVDRQMKIVLCNKPLASILHTQESSILGRDLRQLIHEVRWDIYGIIDQLFNREQNHVQASLFPEGQKGCDLLMHTAPIYNMDREVVGAILAASDITSLKQEQQRVIQREKLALLGQMGAGIVHETKNYLTTIKGSSQILKLIAKDHEVAQFAAKIDKATDEVNRIITSFLTLSKPKALVPESVSLGALMDSMKSMLETTSFLKGVQLTMACPNSEETIYCDENQIKQVVLNMAKNAIEAMVNTEDPRLRIETGYANEDEVYIRIADNGPGIPAAHRNQLGKPFFTTKKNGTGLGLNVSYQIIEEHGGRIELETEEDVGTAFTVVLPLE